MPIWEFFTTFAAYKPTPFFAMNPITNIVGRTQLAQSYFPALTPKSAWRKLRDLLLTDPATAALATLRRRYFLPSEVELVGLRFGRP